MTTGANEGHKIELSFPLRAEFVSVARLTASGIANRVGFDLEDIEDIKVAISEVCNRLITYGGHAGEQCKITFAVGENGIEIKFYVSGMKEAWMGDVSLNDNEASIGLSLIQLLMDEFAVYPGGDCAVMMKKVVGHPESPYAK